MLLIACTNLANLLMSRALARRSEFAVRAAVGASVDRLVRQMMTDSLLLAAAGGALGVVAGHRRRAAGRPAGAVRHCRSPKCRRVDVRMLAGAAHRHARRPGSRSACCRRCACRARRTASALKEGARGGTSRGTERMRSALVVAEIVASVVLLVSAGLLIQALWKVQSTDPGFRSENVLTLKTMLPRPKYRQATSRQQFYRQVMAETRALPGVERAAYVSFTPFTMRGGMWEVLTTKPDPTSLGGFEAPPDVKRAALRYVTPDYFATIGIPILQGRDISATDTLDTTPVAVVSESFGREHFPGQDPIGRQFGFVGAVRTIVGVVGDIRFRGLERNNSEPQVYLAALQQRDDQTGVLRAAGSDRADLGAAGDADARRARRSSGRPIRSCRSPTCGRSKKSSSLETAPRVVQLRVLGGFAAIALLLAAIGIHGLLAFSVSSRVARDRRAHRARRQGAATSCGW